MAERRTWGWIHRWLGLNIGVWFALVGLTGSILVFEDEVDAFLNPGLLVEHKAGPHLLPHRILARADGSIVRLTEGGPAFTRLFKESGYEEREIALMPGDRLVLFTDGVSEATDTAGELFGEERIEELVADSRDLAAHELQRTIVDAAASFSGGELEDDLTLVVVCVDDRAQHALGLQETAQQETA